MITTNSIKIKRNARIQPLSIKLSPSKSESNRALIINAFTGGKCLLENVSNARDTIIMQELLKSDKSELNVLDAGTTMRFLTAFFAVSQEYKILTGTPRMNERPIKTLVDALREIGAEINYINIDGFPPLEIRRFREQKADRISIRGDISSQYISALMMVAPTLPKGLTIEFLEPLNSRPYINMTLSLMEKFGIKILPVGKNVYRIAPQEYKSVNYRIESDWSGASYWYSMISLCEEGSVHLYGLLDKSLQGDRIIADIMANLGVVSSFDENGVKLTKSLVKKSLYINFSDCPDLAQTVAVVCVAKGIPCKMKGLQSLRIKETDRILALENELAKLGARLVESSDEWLLQPGDINSITKPVTIKTYDDHRMAMAFAPLATMTDIIIEDPDVVQKSYPGFWTDLKKAGFEIQTQ